MVLDNDRSDSTSSEKKWEVKPDIDTVEEKDESELGLLAVCCACPELAVSTCIAALRQLTISCLFVEQAVSTCITTSSQLSISGLFIRAKLPWLRL